MSTAAACAATTPAPPPTVDLAGAIEAPAPPSSITPRSAGERALRIDTAASTITFTMNAARETIRGTLAVSGGDLQIDPCDWTRATGAIVVDLDRLELVRARADERGTFGPEEKSELQNTHARTWLEISDDTPNELRQKHRFAELGITKIALNAAGEATAAQRSLVTVTGTLSLHGKALPKTIDLEVTAGPAGDGGAPSTLSVRTVRPFSVGLAEFDILPREAFGRLTTTTLAALAPKVASEALVSVEIRLTREPAPGAAGSRERSATVCP